MQVGSRDLLAKKIYFVKWVHFFIHLNFDISFMILKPLDTWFLRLEKLIYLKKETFKNTITIIGGLVTGTKNSLFPKSSIVRLLLSLGPCLSQFSRNLLSTNCSHSCLKIFRVFLAISSHMT